MENPAPKDASMASVQGSSGVVTGRGMCGEKRNDDRPAGDGALNSGRLVPTPIEEIYLQRINDFQLNGGSAKGTQESDLQIVVRDGSTGHTAKEQAGMQSGQSTHATRGTNTLDSSVSSTLAALGTKAGKEPGHRFRSLARLLDRQMLGEAFRTLKRKAAPGIDGVTHRSIVCFERKDDAETYLRELPGRLAKFGLELAGEKSALVKFNRWEMESSGKFTFLGFDFHWGTSRRFPAYRVVKRSTAAVKFRAGLDRLKDWLKKSRSLRLPEIVAGLKRKLRGHWNYYGVIGNSGRTGAFAYHARLLVYKWLNRRSQRRSFTYKSFADAWNRWQIPSPRVVEKPLPKTA